MPIEFEKADHEPFLNYSDNDGTNVQDIQERNVRPRTAILSHLLIFIVTSILWLLVLYINTPTTTTSTTTKPLSPNERHNITSTATLLSCGSTAAEARSLNCHYDILMNHWIPTPCLDEEFIAEYQDDGSWAAYVDANMTQKIATIDEMSEMEFYYTSVQDHVNHCAEIWRKQFYVLFEEWEAFDSIVASPGHTE